MDKDKLPPLNDFTYIPANEYCMSKEEQIDAITHIIEVAGGIAETRIRDNKENNTIDVEIVWKPDEDGNGDGDDDNKEDNKEE